MKKRFLSVLILTIMMCMSAFIGETVFAAEKTSVEESDVVNIPDAEFKRLLNEKLGVEDPTADITKAQLENISYISIFSFDGMISDITGIEYCTNLENFVFKPNNEIEDFSSLAQLPKLEKLEIFLAERANPEAIFQCENLTTLTLECDTRESFVDLSDIGNLEKLSYLYLRDIKSEDYSAIKNLVNLKILEISNSDIKTLPDLSKCSKLVALSVEYNEALTDISGVKGVTNLKEVVLSYSDNLSDITPLKGLTNIRHLELDGQDITEENEEAYMATLSSLVNVEVLMISGSDIYDKHTSMFDSLTNLKRLDLPFNNITNVEFLLKHKDTLKEVCLYDNSIVNNNIFEQMTNLTVLGIGENNITDFSFISKMPNLTNDSVRRTEWKEHLPTTTFSSIELALPLGTTEYSIMNDVRDENGDYVAPVESEYYTYDEDTHTIILDIEKIVSDYFYDLRIRYNLQMSTVKGETLYAAHYKKINFLGVLNVSNIAPQLYACVGDTITFTADLGIKMNPSRKYKYAFSMIDPNTQETVLIRDYDASNQFVYTLEQAGKYQFVVTFKDQYNNYTSSNSIAIRIYNRPVLKIQHSTEALKIPVGKRISIAAFATAGVGFPDYQYFAINKNTGEKTVLRDTTIFNTIEYTMNIPGEWEVFATIKDTTGIVRETNHVDVTVYGPLHGTLTVNGSADKIAKVQGNKITLKAEGFEGSGDYTYKFAVLDEKTQSWYVLRDFNESDTYTYALNYIGKKQFAVTIKDSAGNTVATNRIYVTVYDKLVGKMTVDGSIDPLIKKVGDSITLNVTATGGSGDYTYKFAVYNEETGKWTVLQNFSKNSSYTTLLKFAGTKQFAVTIKDSRGNTVATNRITVTAKETPIQGYLTVNGSTDAIVTTKGSKVTLKATATGGSGEYTYKFAVLNLDTGNWVVLKDFSEVSYYSFTCNYPGKKQFAVTIKDSNGKTVATNRLTVTVKN